MQELVFIWIFVLAPFVMVWLLQFAGERPNRISVITSVTYSIYAFSVLGTLPLFFMLDEYRVAIGIVKKEVVLLVLLYSLSCIIFLLLGTIFARKTFGLTSNQILSLNIRKLTEYQTIVVAISLILIIGVLCIYIEKIDQIAIFIAIKDSVVDAALARSNMGNNLDGGGAHWYSLILNEIGLLVMCIIYASWLKNKNWVIFLLLLVSLILSVFVSVMSIEKAPFINLLTSLLVTYYLVKSDGFIPIKSIFYFGFIAFGVLIVFYMLFMGSETPMDAFSNVISRAFSGSIAPAYFYLEYYPTEVQYLFGKTFPNPGGVMPYIPIRYTVDMMNWVFPDLELSGIVGSMPTVFWGEAYINFGWIGIPIVSFLMGVLISFVVFFHSHLEINTITIGFNVWIIDHYKKLSQTGFSGYLYDFYFSGVAIFVLMMLLFSGSNIINKIIKCNRKK